MKNTLIAFIACAGTATAALAGNVTDSGSVSLYGNSYPIITWNINADSTGNTGATFGAEGMTFHNGTLYVSHDHNSIRANGQLVKYTPGATGDLTSFTRTAMGSSTVGVFGPEGITVNTSGSGYGSFASGDTANIVGIDSRTNTGNPFGAFGTVNSDTGVFSGQISPVDSVDDITWVGSLGKFLIVVDTPNSDLSSARFLDGTTLAQSGSSFNLVNGAKGVTTVSNAFASSLAGVTFDTAEVLLVISEFETISFFDTNGVARGGEISLSSYLSNATNETESIAVDEVNNLIFLGDEGGRAVHVVTVPAPSALALLGLGGIIASRRRR